MRNLLIDKLHLQGFLKMEVAIGSDANALPSREDLLNVFWMKFGPQETTGWIPRFWNEMGYFSPNEWYEATLSRLVRPGCRWLDVGCGRSMIPNPALASELASRCNTLTGLDPDDTAAENPYLHKLVRVPLEEFSTDDKFDIITLRMVVEHVAEPDAFVRKLTGLLAPGGKVIVYTINKWAPVSLLSAMLPFSLHHRLKWIFWRTEARDTFPVAYRLNTRKALSRHFSAHGCRESSFLVLSDCKLFYRFRLLHMAELYAWRLFQAMHAHYPENCLLAVYERECDFKHFEGNLSFPLLGNSPDTPKCDLRTTE